jgi:hypothetical protein
MRRFQAGRMMDSYNQTRQIAFEEETAFVQHENFSDLFARSNCGYHEGVDRPPILVCASLAFTVLMLAGAIYVLGFYLR